MNRIETIYTGELTMFPNRLVTAIAPKEYRRPHGSDENESESPQRMTLLLALLTIISVASAWAAVGADQVAFVAPLFWVSIGLAVATSVVGFTLKSTRRRLPRWAFILGGLATGLGMLSFRLVGDGAINIAGFLMVILGVTALLIGLIAQNWPSKRAI